MPVSVTTYRALPLETTVLEQTMSARSPSGRSSSPRAAGAFSTGSDSPVSDDSWTRSPVSSKSLPSAGTRFPASSITTSPGTNSLAETSRTWPSLRTFTVGADSCFRATIALSARYSWPKPRAALSTIMTAMAMESS